MSVPFTKTKLKIGLSFHLFLAIHDVTRRNCFCLTVFRYIYIYIVQIQDETVYISYVLIPLGRTCIYLFSLQKWMNNWADWAIFVPALPPIRQELTQVFFTEGVYGGAGLEWTGIRVLMDVCWSSAHLMQCEPDEATSGLGLTRYITWTWYVCLFIDMQCLSMTSLPSAGSPAEPGSHSATNQSSRACWERNRYLSSGQTGIFNLEWQQI